MSKVCSEEAQCMYIKRRVRGEGSGHGIVSQQVVSITTGSEGKDTYGM